MHEARSRQSERGQCKRDPVHKKNKVVWVKIPRAQARSMGIKVIGTKLTDINKGDDANPNYRSRFVANEFNNSQMDGLFAATPPLEALKYLIHQAATVDDNGRTGERPS